MADNKQNTKNESVSVLEIPTVLEQPIDLKFADHYIYCPICSIEIDLENRLIRDGDSAYCEDCEHKILLRVVKI